MTGLQPNPVSEPRPMVQRRREKAVSTESARRRPPRAEEVVAFLSAPGAFGPEAAERIDTHISHVFLYGDRAWKLKRPVNTGFLDFSTPEARKRACEHELEINRRISGDLYRRIRTVTQEPEGLALDGKGPAVDWLVEMERFDADAEFDILARRGKLTEDMAARLARRIAGIHKEAPRRPDCGGAREMRALTADTVSGLMGFRHQLGGLLALSGLSLKMRRELDETARLLEARRRFGCVRHCHADLHLANICLYRGEPTPFDAIEFDDRMASIDVIYDMAFTVMDLIHEGLDGHANRFLNAWAETTRDYGGLRILPLSMALRAAIRARVLLLTARLSEPARAARKIEAARSYFGLAARLVNPGHPLLLAIGGRSGTGKSTLARHLALEIAPAPGAVILRSDVIRKRMFGQEPEEKLPKGAYRTRVSARVFREMFKDARRALGARQTVILDATFLAQELRDETAAFAGRNGVPFTGLWLDAPERVLLPRLAARLGDASDADADVLIRQRGAGRGPADWKHVDASRPMSEVRRQVHTILSACGYAALEDPGGGH